MSVLLAAGLVLVAFTAAAGMGVAWRTWRRLAVLRLNLGSLEDRVGALEEDVLGLARFALLVRYREKGHQVPERRIPLQSHSQHGEDALLWELLGEKTSGYYVEVGAYDGVSFSNSYFFEAIGWTGLLVEPNPDLYARCREARPASRVVQAAVGGRDASGSVRLFTVGGRPGVDALSYTRADQAHVERIRREGGQTIPVDVPLTSLDALLALAPPAAVDFVSVDVEGAELEVLDGLRLEKWRPQVLLVEDNSGGRDTRVAEYVARHGYRHVRRRGCNVLYSRD